MSEVRAWDALPAGLRAALESGTTVVTPNNRLARRLNALYDERQRAAGKAVWHAARCLPWSGWLERLWEESLAAVHDRDPPLLIGEPQAIHSWTRIVAADKPDLADISGAAALASEAWSLLHAWGGGSTSWRAWTGSEDDSAAFARWAESYANGLRRADHIDLGRLPDELLAAAPAVVEWRSAEVALAGFIETTPQQQRLLAALAGVGMQIARLPSVAATANRTEWRAVAATPRDEVIRALRWAREQAAEDPSLTIGIAIEDLAARREEVRALAEEVLCPALQWPGREDVPRPYNLSLGTAVSEIPLVAAALDAIALAYGPLPMGRAAALLRSPYLAGGPHDWLRRGSLEARWLEQGYREVTLEDIAVGLAAIDSALAARISSVRAGDRVRGVLSPREWLDGWRRVLDIVGWPGDRPLASSEWQAKGAFEDVLAQFAALASVAPQLTRRDALQSLLAIARRQVFQPEAPEAPVQILGLLEAAGLPLDALWVAGLAAERWPPSPQPNPLLPVRWQQERAVPRSTVARELAYARTLVTQWAAGAPHVVFSYARRVDDHQRSLSALVPEAPWLDDSAMRYPSTARAQFERRPRLESIVDDYAPELAAEVVKGGAGFIEAQSDCPFRASALYRFAAEPWPAPIDGLSPLERGILIHAALAHFWREVGSHEKLVNASGETLAEWIDAAVRSALVTLPEARRRRLPAVVRAEEKTRIATLLNAWLNGVERTRPPFFVDEVEVLRPLVLNGLSFTLRLDRIDTLESGAAAIIDYKTGVATSPAKWFDPRPQSPQLGLYALAQHAFATAEPVRAVAYAQLKAGGINVRGLAADETLWPGLMHPAEIKRAGLADWGDVQARWRDSLTNLAVEIRDGRADVSPRDPSVTCRYCGLQPFCRIGAAAADAEVDDDE